MAKFIVKFPLSHFEELVPFLMRCFPDFWGPRLARGMRSFPYDLRLFVAKLEGRIVGSVGVHDYQFLFDGYVTPCGGLCDVAVDPDFRGRGYAFQLQEFALDFCRRYYVYCPMMPLYTDKPGVYERLGWNLYESDRSAEIRTEDFPKGKDAFRLDFSKIGSSYLRGKKLPETEEENVMHAIRRLYMRGRNFEGKCMRSSKTWLEIFAEPSHEWVLHENTYFLYKNDRLLEAYSSDPEHPVSQFTPVHGGHDSNKLMLNLQCGENVTVRKLAAAVETGRLIFPVADTF